MTELSYLMYTAHVKLLYLLEGNTWIMFVDLQ